MKTHYETLGVRPDAPPEEIKRAFRREIARYHPDKVQHLGAEFQELAALRAAELTQAYRVLMDAALREAYDAQLETGPVAPPPPPEQARPPAPSGSEVAPPPPEPESWFEPEADSRTFEEQRHSGDNFVRREALRRMRNAIVAALGPSEEFGASGFELCYECKARRGLFKKAEPDLRVLARYVSKVDAAAINETWPMATRAATGPDASICVFLMGSGFASRSELTAAITAQRRRARRRSPLVFVPLDVRDWNALVPTDAPAAVKTIIEWLQKPS